MELIADIKKTKFSCEICEYITDHKSKFDRHLLTAKHLVGIKNLAKKGQYYCAICDIETDNKTNYEKHKMTAKHQYGINGINGIEKLQKKDKKRDIDISNQNDIEISDEATNSKYILSSVKSLELTGNVPKNEHVCKKCNKSFKGQSGLWKHNKKCTIQNNYEDKEQEQGKEQEKEKEPDVLQEELEEELEEVTPPPIMQNLITPELVIMLIQQNKDMQRMMMEQSQSMRIESKTMMESMLELVKHAGHNTNNIQNNNNIQNHNKAFNLNFFLNETCKDAMNMSDFVKNMVVTTDDFEQTGMLGYVNGICRILENSLNKLEVHERPIHCTDLKRETIYIKDNDKWEKDDDNKTKLLGAIKQIGAKNISVIPQWCKEHPGWSDSDSKENDRYLKYVFNAMCGSTDEEIYKNYGDIMRYMARITMVDKREAILL
jgi:hypothetical protein